MQNEPILNAESVPKKDFDSFASLSRASQQFSLKIKKLLQSVLHNFGVLSLNVQGKLFLSRTHEVQALGSYSKLFE